MRRIIYIHCLILIISTGFTLSLAAQDFTWKSAISGIKTDGFYKIQLAPEIVSKLNDQLGDIRIYDSKSKEVQYIFESEKPLNYTDYFVEYKIIEKKEQTSWPYYTRIVLQNPSKSKISNFHLIIKNSDVSKNLKLSGSDDGQNWYIIKSNYHFQAMYSDLETSVIKIIDFPVSNYEYYEILIDDWKNNPINIQKAGFYNTLVEKGKYSVVEMPEMSQIELKEEKQSLVKLNFKSPQLIHKLEFRIEGPEFYYRKAEIQVRDSAKNRRNEYEYFFRTVDNVVFSSNSSNTFYFNDLRSNSVYIRVSNQDDQPVIFKGVNVEQLNHYLICKLEALKDYTLKFGDAGKEPPVYDLSYFSDKIPDRVPIVKTGEIVSTGKSMAKPTSGIQLDKKFIWIAIVLVIILLVYMISRMLKEMKKSKNE